MRAALNCNLCIATPYVQLSFKLPGITVSVMGWSRTMVCVRLSGTYMCTYVLRQKKIAMYLFHTD